MMKHLALVAAVAVTLVAGSARAQTATDTGTTSNNPVVDITVTGNVTSAVRLDITGSGTTILSATTSATSPAIAAGTLAFGSFSTINLTTATNTTFKGRTTTGTAGAIVAGTLSATLTFGGASSGNVTLQRKTAAGTSPDVPLSNLLVSSPPLSSWTAATNGAVVPDAGASGYNICTNAGDASCLNAKAYLHQLAVFVPDTQLAGPFSTIVEYTGTAL